jgi:hypothetical protein
VLTWEVQPGQCGQSGQSGQSQCQCQCVGCRHVARYTQQSKASAWDILGVACRLVCSQVQQKTIFILK